QQQYYAPQGQQQYYSGAQPQPQVIYVQQQGPNQSSGLKGSGGLCAGLCAGFLCFECCEICF
ncbi:hypothetical protein LPJ60_005279, partial [Coemansia sp. RSA 2675]